MKKLESTNNLAGRTSVEDGEILPSRGLRSKGLRIAAALAALVLVAAIGWAANHFYIEPKRDEAIVAQAKPDWVAKLKGVARLQFEAHQGRLSEEDRMWENLNFLKGPAEKTKASNSALIYQSALRQAIRSGIPEAKLLYGIALRDGIFGPKDSLGALEYFDQVEREMVDGLRAGDAIATYVNARMWLDGLGRTPDRTKAVDLARRVGPNLNGWRLVEIARHVIYGEPFSGGSPDLDLGKKLAERMLEQKLEEGPNFGSSTCKNSIRHLKDECKKRWYERAVNAGMDTAIPHYAELIVATGGALSDASKWFKRGEQFSTPEERYMHAFVEAIRSASDVELLKALAEMWKQTEVDSTSPYPVGLSEGRGLDPFIDRADKIAPDEIDNFLIGLATYGKLTGHSKEFLSRLFYLPSLRNDLFEIAHSVKIQGPARIAAESIRSGRPLDTVNLQRTGGFVPLVESAGRQASVKSADSEQQGFTGYIKGEPKGATGGLSTFTVDNRQGDHDAVARIYLDGAKPAVRHMYIKRGETFKAQSIQAGTYAFRYRYIGSEDTYEADRSFQLTQTQSNGGTRFSNVTVTLFKVKDGNMQTKKVDASKF